MASANFTKKRPVDIFEGYCEATGIHGMQYMTRYPYILILLWLKALRTTLGETTLQEEG